MSVFPVECSCSMLIMGDYAQYWRLQARCKFMGACVYEWGEVKTQAAEFVSETVVCQKLGPCSILVFELAT